MIFYLLGLTLVAWVILEGWFALEMILKGTEKTSIDLAGLMASLRPAPNTHRCWPDEAAKGLHALFDKIAGSRALSIIIGITWIILMRIFWLIKSLLFLAIMVFVAVVDGLVQRDIRKYRGDRESALTFHRLVSLILWLLPVLYLVWLAVPVALNRQQFLLIATAMTAVPVMLAVKHFRKYL